jgi:hypothetical protein
MNAGSFFLHVGLPRTASTTMQREVFPKLQGITYLGKLWNNTGLMNGEINLIQLIDQWMRNSDTESDHYKNLMGVMPTLLKIIKNNNQLKRHQQAVEHVKALAQFINGLRGKLPEHNFLYSDESLIESVAGLSSNNEHGATVPLEQLGGAGLLKGIAVLLVLRDPEAFLRASWYKNNEFQHKYGLQPYSFDTWVRKQLALFVCKRSASRIYQAMHKSFTRHVRAYCPDLHITHYEALQQCDDVMASLTGGRISTPGVSLKSLPKENSSFRNLEVVDFVLSAPGVPKGIDMQSYTQTFESTLKHYEIWDILKSERLHEMQPLKS